MHVAEILREKGRAVETATGTATLAEIIAKLAERRIGAIVIVDRMRVVTGIVSERDIVQALAQQGNAALKLPASQIMSTDLVNCQNSDTIDELMAIMTNRRIRHLPVIEDGELAGIVSIGDVVKHRVAEVELEASAMRDYIAAGATQA